MKKFLALLLALTMVLSLGMAAFAAPATKPAPTTEHQYKAYQIFSGTQGEGSELGNVVWGNGIDADGFLAELVKLDAYKDCKTAADVAAVVGQYSDNSPEAKQFAKIADNFIVKANGVPVVNGQTALDAGYYLVVDVTEKVGEDDAYNLSLLQLTKKSTFDINLKSEVPEVEKKIVENGDKVDSNTAAIGDKIPYEISTKVPAKSADYDYYFFIIRDTMSAGLTFNDDIVVTIDGKEAKLGEDYNVKTGDDAAPYTFQIALVDANDHAGQDVVVTYSATLNKDAVVGVEGNPNKVDLQYSNNPNEDYDKIPHGNKPGFPDDKTYNPGGETPEDITKTYTTEIRIYKVDQDGKALQGAEFTLSGEGVNKTIVAKEVFEANANGEYWKLNDNSYTKDAPITADYMEAAAAGAKDGYVVAEEGFEGETITVGGVAYRVVNEGETPAWVLVHANADQYASTTDKYSKSTKLETVSQNAGTTTVVGTVDEKGNVVFSGLGEGEYTLTETKTPAGYNTIAPIKFTISCELPKAVVDGTEKCKWNVESESEIVYSDADQAFEITVVNNKGGELPETGGIGTTIFYVVGAVLVLAAGILLITKKRMGAEG